MRYTISILFSLLIAASCSTTTEDLVCYGFDLRQCRGDEWFSDFNQAITSPALSDASKTFLENNGITVDAVSVNVTFHEVVCEACFVCPQGPRIYVRINKKDADQIEALELLNLSISDCSLGF